GSMSALQAAEAIRRGIHRADPSIHIDLLPMADGGEGFVEAILAAMPGEMIHVSVQNPMGKEIKASYGLIEGGKTAVIEMAAASGLTLVSEQNRNPMYASTYGTGQLIADALDRECEQIIIGIGGSATNDGGMGMAQALGYRFYT